MDDLASRVHVAVKAVCPIDGVRLVDPARVNSWELTPSAGASASQVAAGRAALLAYRLYAPEIPEVVGLWAARAVLKMHGLFDPVNSFVEAQHASNPVIWEAWNMGNTLARKGVFVSAIGPTFGLSEGDIDAMFIEAAALQS